MIASTFFPLKKELLDLQESSNTSKKIGREDLLT